MKEQLERVIRKIILPHYPQITGFEVESIYGSHGSSITTYYIRYFYNFEDNLMGDGDKLRKDTITLFKMLSPDGKSTIYVIYICNKP